jgi:hypothetical protein
MPGVLAAHILPTRPPAFRRGAAAGAAWGVTLAAAFVASDVYRCSAVTPADAVQTAALCVTAGLVAIGPLVAFARRT